MTLFHNYTSQSYHVALKMKVIIGKKTLWCYYSFSCSCHCLYRQAVFNMSCVLIFLFIINITKQGKTMLHAYFDHLLAGFPPYLNNLENLEFCQFQASKMPGILSKVEKSLNFNSKPEKNVLHIQCFKYHFFQNIIYKKTTSSTLSTQAQWFEPKLTLNFIDSTWK